VTHAARAFLVMTLLAVFTAYAKEGPDQYPYGAENWMAGAFPPPGTYFLNYFGYYSGQLRDGSGNKVSLGGTTPSVNAVFDAVRAVHSTKYKFLGAFVGAHFIAPFVRQSMDLGGSQSRAGIGDLIGGPVLAWHGKDWHFATGLDIALPVGTYDKNDPRRCIGAHYFSFEPIAAFTVMPAKGWETSAKLMYNTKTENTATHYQSGDDFHMDYAVGKHVGGWAIGVSGYFLKQVTDDRVAGQVAAAVPGLWTQGRRGQVFAAGPSVSYTNKRHMTFVAQWHPEMAVRNRFSGNKLWFKMIIPL
jgi:hypothetical protein